MIRRLAALVAIVVPALLPGGAATADESPDFDRLVRQFEVVAFGSEFGGLHREGRIVKWAGPIRVRIRGFDADRYRDEVRDHLRDLERLTGLEIRLITWSSGMVPPDIDVNFVSARGMHPQDPLAPCLTRAADTHFILRRAEIFIAPEETVLRRHCIVEELTQAMGLLRDSTLIARSIFNDDYHEPEMTAWDALMVRVLYDPAIRPGMTAGEAMPIARAIIAAELQRIGIRTTGAP